MERLGKTREFNLHKCNFHSSAIMAKRKEYYALLDKTQKGTLEITQWLLWFLSTLIDAVELSKVCFEQVLYKTRFWQRHAQTELNEREIKVLNRLFDSYGEAFPEGNNASKYKSTFFEWRPQVVYIQI